MSNLAIVPVAGGQPSCANRSRCEEKRTQAQSLASLRESRDFVTFGVTEEEDEECMLNATYNLADFLRSRELNLKEKKSIGVEYPLRKMITHELFKEFHITLPKMNSIVCSQWLTDKQIIFGTKCFKIMLYDVKHRKMEEIPVVGNSSTPLPTPRACGINSIRFNPSKTLMVTKATSPCSLAVYRIPTMEPIHLGENSHSDWICDFSWLDDEIFVSASRDNNLGLWKVDDDDEKLEQNKGSPRQLSPLNLKPCKKGRSIRALIYNSLLREIFTVNSNGYIHIWDPKTLQQIYSGSFFLPLENACIALRDRGPYAIANQSYTQIIDSRSLSPVKKIDSTYHGYVRSLSFRGNILTLTTADGAVLFYDVRSHSYLDSSVNAEGSADLKCTKLNVDYPDETIRERLNARCTPAILTHCYNSTGTQLFTAGGPMPNNINGCYAAIWQ